MIDIPELVERVTEELIAADERSGDGVPDYGFLAQVAVSVVLKAVASEAIAEAVQG